MKVRDIMTSDPVVLRPEMSVREAAALFAERSIDGAPVVDQEGRMQGLFTKTHILRVVGARGDLDAPIVELMQRKVTAARPDQDLDEALDPSLGRIPVVDEAGRAVGMITRTDLAKAFFDRFRNVSIEMDTLVNSTHNLIVCVDEHGRINLFNKQAEKFLEARAEDVIGKPVNDVFPTSGLAEVARTGKVEPVQKIMLNNRYFISNRSPIIKDGKIRGA
ncbi:MAG: CBS domain-containing protein, partial [Syntrophomonadaceae bacterium]|nr:CBS domain-containing protein [Syntrophomonadaceae bacterium]